MTERFLRQRESKAIAMRLLKMDVGFLSRNRYPGKQSPFLFFMAFEPEVWMAVMLTLPFLALVSRCTAKPLGLKFLRLWDVARVLINEGVQDRVPASSSGRIIPAVWFICGFILSAAWSGKILTLLVYEPPEIKIETLKDLSEQEELKVLAIEGEPTWEYIKSEVDDIARRLSPRVEPVGFDDDAVGRDTFLRGAVREASEVRFARFDFEMKRMNCPFTDITSWDAMLISLYSGKIGLD